VRWGSCAEELARRDSGSAVYAEQFTGSASVEYSDTLGLNSRTAWVVVLIRKQTCKHVGTLHTFIPRLVRNSPHALQSCENDQTRESNEGNSRAHQYPDFVRYLRRGLLGGVGVRRSVVMLVCPVGVVGVHP
jgi:hypothetical protein